MGMPLWGALPLVLVGALLQTSLIPSLGFIAVRPNFVLEMVVLWAVVRGSREGLVWALAGGIVLDFFSGAPFGVATLALLLVAFCSSLGEISMVRTSPLLPIIVVFWASVLYALLYLFLLRTLGYPVQWLATLRHIVVPNAILDTLFAPLVYLVLSRIERRTRRAMVVEW